MLRNNKPLRRMVGNFGPQMYGEILKGIIMDPNEIVTALNNINGSIQALWWAIIIGGILAGVLS